MATKTLQIEENKARKIYKTAHSDLKAILEETFGKEFFSEKITDRIKNWQDILNYLNINENFLPYPNPKTKEEKSLNAQAKLFKIAEVYNEGTVLDWKNTNQYKYRPYKYWSGGRWVVVDDDFWSRLHAPAGLHYKNAELSKDSLNKFEDIWNDYYMVD